MNNSGSDSLCIHATSEDDVWSAVYSAVHAGKIIFFYI